MGAVLAMRAIWTALGLGAALALTGCSNAPVESSATSALVESGAALGDLVRRPGRGGAAAPQPITRAQLDQISVPVLYVELQRTGAGAAALVAGRNRQALTWHTVNKIAFTTKSGVLFSTRGLGGDLLAAQTEATLRALRQGGAPRYARDMRYIAGDETIRKERYFCEMESDGPAQRVVVQQRFQTTQMRETCYALEGHLEFRNVYWIGSDGTIWDSRQWVGPAVGYVALQRLVK